MGQLSTSCFQKRAYCAGIKPFRLPSSIKSLTNEKAQFKRALKYTHILPAVRHLLSKSKLQSTQRFV
jgi:hypothetical protein